jgi:HD-GYP domain-containing protein (c-di-GMP phosphodiesterase class II)
LKQKKDRISMADKNAPNLGQERLQQLNDTARLVLALLGARDARLREHSERVANAAAHFAGSEGLLRGDDLHHLYLAGLLHDTGYVSAPPDLLDAPLDPPEDQAVLVKRHPVVGVEILAHHRGYEALLGSVRHHHEAFDGSGYPDGIKGEEIPLGARILHLFDCYDRLTAGGRAGKGLSREEALAAMFEQAGREFDPKLMPRFVAFVEAGAGGGRDFLADRETSAVKRSLAEILHKFSAGKIVPPAMPQVVFGLRKVIQRQDSSVMDLADVLEKDPVISLRLISVAKSPVYKGYGEIGSVQAAIPRLGFKETLNIVVAISNKSLYEVRLPQVRVLLDKMWVHTLATAYAAKLIGQSLLLDDPDNLFLMGLTHDVGKVILLRAFAEIPQGKELSYDLIVSAIQDAHQPIGVMLVKRWGFGDEFARVIALHEGSNFTPETESAILVVHLANLLARKMGYSFFEWDSGEPADLPSARILGVTAEMLAKIEGKVKAIIQDVAHLF